MLQQILCICMIKFRNKVQKCYTTHNIIHWNNNRFTFEKDGDEDDVVFSAKTILSIACNTIYENLPEKNATVTAKSIPDTITINIENDVQILHL